MNKEQSADDPSVDLIRVKNMLNSTISMSYPDVVIACIEHKVSLEAVSYTHLTLPTNREV
ncbi:hypothetical protein JMUB7524_26760 [Staphylococcus aureus]